MNVIHYLIGIPPYRHGGAPAYALDLAKAMSKIDNCHVCLLIPGDTMCFGNKAKMISSDILCDLECFEIKNPVIEPLLHGIKKAEYILSNKRKLDKKNLDWFYECTKPDILHIHTLMGIPMDLLTYMKGKGVKIVITSHDYYGICPRVNLIDRFGYVCQDGCGKLCEDCNMHAKNKSILKILNSKAFLKYKKMIPNTFLSKKRKLSVTINSRNLLAFDDSKFIELRCYYNKMFGLIDAFHFNSKVAKSVYSRFLDLPYNEVIPITTNSISDRRNLKKIGEIIEFAFVAGLGEAKGFPLLKKVLLEIYNEGITNWTLNVWEGCVYGIDSECENIVYRGRYTQQQLPKVYEETDLLIVPSKWKETFSLVALEALSFGVPVLMSVNVGAQILIENIAPNFIYQTEEELKNKLRKILENPSVLAEYNQNIIVDKKMNFSEEQHVKDILDFYNKVKCI